MKPISESFVDDNCKGCKNCILIVKDTGKTLNVSCKHMKYKAEGKKKCLIVKQ